MHISATLVRLTQLIKCMAWRRGEKTTLLITYGGIGLCKNMGPISSRVYIYMCIESAKG